MLVVSVLLLSVCTVNCYLIILPEIEVNSDLITCIVNITRKYYKEKKVVTYVDFHANFDGFLTVLNDSPKISIVSRGRFKKVCFIHQGYLINTKGPAEFLYHIEFLLKEFDWNPSARFVIVIENLCQMEKIFNKLHKLHIINVIVINGTNQADIYTYNPFENYACGRYFDRVISYGPCASTQVLDFFPNKLQTGLRNCTINIAVSHLNPYTFKPGICGSDPTSKAFCKGTEQYAFELMSKLEHFNVNYSYLEISQEFSSIDKDMKAIGSFSLIQNNQTDGILGFTILSLDRSKAFCYIYKHMTYTDELIYVVKKAGYVPLWKNLYLEFNETVWIMFFVAFVISTILIIFLTKSTDKSAILLKIWDSLFLHGFYVHCKISLRFFLIVWIWFAFMINTFYQSSLMSLTTHPSLDFQIQTEKDITRAKLKPCVMRGLADFLQPFEELRLKDNMRNCGEVIQSLKKVSKSYKLYTIVPHDIYEYNSAMFRSDEVKIYRLKTPVMKLIYALFLYKGFPWAEKLEMRALQLRENGLIEKHNQYVYYYNELRHRKDQNIVKFTSRSVVPWELLLMGCLIATFAFILEVLGKNVATVVS